MEQKIRETTKINELLQKAAQTDNADLQLQMVFFDPSEIGVFDLEELESNVELKYLNKWYELYDLIEKRIVLYFVKYAQEYRFKSLTTTADLRDGQLPEIVITFINQQVLPDAKTYEEAISLAVNALKNAFDQRFKNNLIENAATLFEDQQYYKGYSCIDFDYYFVKSEERESKREFGCNLLYYPVGESYTDVFVSNSPLVINPSSEQSNVMDYYSGKDLARQHWNLSLNKYEDVLLTREQKRNLFIHDGYYKNVNSMNYVYDYLKFSSPNTIYTALNDSRIPNDLRSKLDEIRYSKYLFKEWRYNGALGSPLSFHEGVESCEGTHTVNVINGRIRTRTDPVDEMHGISTWGTSTAFRNAQPTWCNVFARILSGKVFGHDAFPAKSCKDLFNQEFTTKKDQYAEIAGDDRNPKYIWGLINKGFPVYFISTAHIETGFPDKYAHTAYRYRYENDERYLVGTYTSYLDSSQPYESSNETKSLVVGAGTTVGFKESWDTYSWLKKDYTKVYLYLGYLRNIY